MQTVWYINNILNNRFKDHFLHEKSDLEILKTELQQITSTEEIDSEYEARLSHINHLIETRDFEGALKIANFKGTLTKQIAKNTIVDKYPDRIINLIKCDADLRNQIKRKYFNMINTL